MASEANGTISCSIEETNEIRRKLGLKPLLVEKSEAPQEKTKQLETETISEHLDLIKRRRIRDSLIEGDSIVDSIKKRQPIISKKQQYYDNYDEVDPLDLTAWAKKMGSMNSSRANHLEGAVTYSDDETEDEGIPPDAKEDGATQAKVKILHKMNDLNLLKGEEVALTLKDIGIFEAESAGIADIDFLENTNIVEMNKKGKVGVKNFDYSPYDEDENEPNKDGTKFLKHYDDVIKDHQGLKLTSLASDDNGFFVTIDNAATHTIRTNIHEIDNYDSLDHSASFKNTDRKKKLIKHKHKPINWNKVFVPEGRTEDDNIEFVAPKKIKKTIHCGMDFDDVEDCNRLYNQLSSHIRRSIKPDKANTPNKTSNLIDIKTDDVGFEITSTSEFCKIVKTPLEKVEEHDSSVKWRSTLSRDTDVSETGDEKNFVFVSEKPMGSGLADALSYIKDRGNFSTTHHENDHEAHLTKLDSYGRMMTPKEEFRQLSWVFHGKGPGMNKRDRKIRRMERERLARENPVEGLPTMKALRAHQSNQETTHLILTGNSHVS